MIEINNQDIFGKVIADALVKIDGNTGLQAWQKHRWLNAVAKATVEIENNGAFMDWQEDKQTLLIWSDRSNNIYEANGVCQCKAFEMGQPCWHKAAKQIVKNYLAALMTPPQVEKATTPAPASISSREMINAPYLKTTSNKKTETFGGVRI